MQVAVVIRLDLYCKTENVFLELSLESVASEGDQACHGRIIMGFAEHLLTQESPEVTSC